MKRLIVILALAAVLLPGTLASKDNDFGLGIILGEPTGISFKKWVGSNTAIDGAAAWAFSNDPSLHFHADYLFHNFSVFNVKKGRLPLYYGIGVRFKGGGDNWLGVRIPVGICYMFEKAPLDIFYEIGPVLDLAPDVRLRFTSSIGVRYYF